MQRAAGRSRWSNANARAGFVIIELNFEFCKYFFFGLRMADGQIPNSLLLLLSFHF